jgi:hypothetical protein
MLAALLFDLSWVSSNSLRVSATDGLPMTDLPDMTQAASDLIPSAKQFSVVRLFPRDYEHRSDQNADLQALRATDKVLMQIHDW